MNPDCMDFDYDSYYKDDHYKDDHYYNDYDYNYYGSACQGYAYDFDLIFGIKPQNSTSSAPFSYCTQEHVEGTMGKKIVNQWMEEVRPCMRSKALII